MKRFLNGTQIVLFFTFTCFSAFLLSAIYFGVSISKDQLLLEYKEQYYKDQSYKLAYAIQSHFNSQMNLEEQKKWLEQFSTVYAIGVRYYAPDMSTVMYDTTGRQRMAVKPYDIDVPLFVDGKLIGYLRAQFDLNKHGDISNFLGVEQESSFRLIFIFAGLFMISLIISYFLARRLSKPVVTSSKIAGLIASGNREMVVPVTGTSDLKQIASTINALLADFDRQEDWRKQMMQDLAHELRTPLTSMMSRIEAMIDGVYPITNQHLHKIYNEIDRLFRLVVDLEKLSEAEGARFMLHIQRVDMTQLVKDVYEEFMLMAREKGIRVVFQNPHVPCYAEVDPDRMIQVVSNLLTNAIKYTPEGGSIEIGLYLAENNIVIYCRDNGIGISSHDLELIFNRFYRVDKSRTRESGGIGVGLSIAKALVEAHEGTIEVESNLGKGSNFYFSISEAGGS